MALDPRLWTELEHRGVSNAHLEMLVRYLRAGTNGHIVWHWRQGRMDHCDMQMSFSGKPFEVARVCTDVLPMP